MTKFYVDQSGNYLGGFDGAAPPAGAVQVPSAPTDARQMWNGAAWVPPSFAPEIISPRQFRQALTYYGFRANVDGALSASTDQNLKDWYQYATVFERHHPQVLAMATQLGYTSAQLDSVWTYGASI